MLPLIAIEVVEGWLPLTVSVDEEEELDVNALVPAKTAL
jgi:hypothetical protein